LNYELHELFWIGKKQSAGIKFDELMRTMTIENVERLSRQFGDTLAPEENYNI